MGVQLEIMQLIALLDALEILFSHFCDIALCACDLWVRTHGCIGSRVRQSECIRLLLRFSSVSSSGCVRSAPGFDLRLWHLARYIRGGLLLRQFDLSFVDSILLACVFLLRQITIQRQMKDVPTRSASSHQRCKAGDDSDVATATDNCRQQTHKPLSRNFPALHNDPLYRRAHHLCEPFDHRTWDFSAAQW